MVLLFGILFILLNLFAAATPPSSFASGSTSLSGRAPSGSAAGTLPSLRSPGASSLPAPAAASTSGSTLPSGGSASLVRAGFASLPPSHPSAPLPPGSTVTTTSPGLPPRTPTRPAATPPGAVGAPTMSSGAAGSLNSAAGGFNATFPHATSPHRHPPAASTGNPVGVAATPPQPHHAYRVNAVQGEAGNASLSLGRAPRLGSAGLSAHGLRPH